MGEFIVAHKIALLLIGVAIGGFVLLTRRPRSADAGGYPVNPYAANAPSQGGSGGGFNIGQLLPSGPAGPLLDPSPQVPGTAAAAPEQQAVAPADLTAGEAPPVVDNAPATPGGSNGIPALQSTSFSDTPYEQLPTSIQEGLYYGYPIQPDGSVLASSVLTPEPIPADSTFGSGRSLEFGGLAPATASEPDAVDRWLTNHGTDSARAPSLSTGPGPAPATSLPLPESHPYASRGTVVAA